ncbi:hypothetical protein BO70DRAFT_383235 [Aspergillus heteromorphus CBS 117.55]|uniref:Zn(2)-C6 fungal-type domain-containing protein n=1 Tax=Aspergillus heteromorphus CBS 117.55 TaxID=1448321 RepID=A0A317UYU9_9EURO|nr:uncharacterized protein BO70DRAFT_383235 [Aspergillus heteromorphus CBS 117.55]PWY65697.1 hypothetical protein BO70DRAFT_383235 [Aspergillus heteromorphus CBS 117.55]
MSPSQRVSLDPRRKQIPGTLVLNWQSPETRNKKPLARRPMTACQACRTAKAKCSGLRRCERCKSRGLRCSYASSTSQTRSDDANDNESNGNIRAGASTTTISPNDEVISDSVATPFPTDAMPVDFPDIFTNSGEDHTPPSHAMEQTFTQALEQFDWVFPGDICLPSPNPPISPPPNPLPFFSQHPQQHPQPQPQQQQGTETSKPHCPCRPSLLHQIPLLEATLQNHPPPPLDKILHHAHSIIQACQTATQCRSCPTSPVDLVYIMTIFEQTATCFDLITKSGVNDVVKVGIGSYCVSRTDDDGALKRVLVGDLVRRARGFLDGMEGLALGVGESENGGSGGTGKRGVMGRSPRCLNQLNLEYVRVASESFRKLFGVMEGVFGDTSA